MLESEIKKLTAAVTELSDTFKAARSPRTGAVPSKTSAPVVTPEAPKISQSEPTPEPTPSVADAFGAAAAAVAGPVAAAPPAAGGVEAAAIAAPAQEAETVPTKKEMVEKFIEMAQSQPREVAITLLAKYNIAKLPELTDKSRWAPFLADCVALLAAAEAAAK